MPFVATNLSAISLDSQIAFCTGMEICGAVSLPFAVPSLELSPPPPPRGMRRGGGGGHKEPKGSFTLTKRELQSDADFRRNLNKFIMRTLVSED